MRFFKDTPEGPRMFTVRQTIVEERMTNFVLREIAQRHMNPKDMDSVMNRIKVLTNWIYDDSQRRGLVIYGEPGTGKTTFARALYSVLRIIQNNDPAYVTAKTWLDCVTKREEDWQLADTYWSVKRAGVVVLDDMGNERMVANSYGNALTPVVDLIEECYVANVPMIITTNLNHSINGVNEIKERYGDRIYDRLREMCEFKFFGSESFRGDIS